VPWAAESDASAALRALVHSRTMPPLPSGLDLKRIPRL